jgi:hypothetical protein
MAVTMAEWTDFKLPVLMMNDDMGSRGRGEVSDQYGLPVLPANGTGPSSTFQ